MSGVGWKVGLAAGAMLLAALYGLVRERDGRVRAEGRVEVQRELTEQKADSIQRLQAEAEELRRQSEQAEAERVEAENERRRVEAEAERQVDRALRDAARARTERDSTVARVVREAADSGAVRAIVDEVSAGYEAELSAVRLGYAAIERTLAATRAERDALAAELAATDAELLNARSALAAERDLRRTFEEIAGAATHRSALEVWGERIVSGAVGGGVALAGVALLRGGG